MIYVSLAILTIIAFGITFLAYHRARQAAKFDATVAGAKSWLATPDQEHVDRLMWENINLRAALIDIRNQGIASKSGTAQSMARKAKAAL